MISRRKKDSSIFVVDAHLDDYQALVPELEDSGYQVELCSSGRAALRRGLSTAPALWVIGMNLPDISGPELVSLLRWQYPKARICMVSDEYSVEEEIEARRSGPELHVSKPLDSTWLVEAVGELVAV